MHKPKFTYKTSNYLRTSFGASVMYDKTLFSNHISRIQKLNTVYMSLFKTSKKGKRKRKKNIHVITTKIAVKRGLQIPCIHMANNMQVPT